MLYIITNLLLIQRYSLTGINKMKLNIVHKHNQPRFYVLFLLNILFISNYLNIMFWINRVSVCLFVCVLCMYKMSFK